jgi:hypothetical protein
MDHHYRRREELYTGDEIGHRIVTQSEEEGTEAERSPFYQ